METLVKKSERKNRKSNWRIYSILFSFLVLFAINGMAESESVKKENTAKKAIEDQKRIERQTFMSYVYMSVGFALIIGIAGAVSFRKRKKSATESGGNHHILKHHHSSHDKRYGSSRVRG